jgi:predicted naringenin-chalcone synthase
MGFKLQFWFANGGDSRNDCFSFSRYYSSILEKNNLKIEDIDHLIFHPGGKKIVQTVESLFSSLGKNIDDTKEVLRLYGNMSSATVLYVLERIMDDQPKKGKGLMLSLVRVFGAKSFCYSFSLNPKELKKI